jgi:hypothetical protein
MREDVFSPNLDLWKEDEDWFRTAGKYNPIPICIPLLK